MFLRIVRNRAGEGAKEYVRLVESCREAGKVRQRVICTLGRKDLLSAYLPKLVKILQGQSSSSVEGSKIQALGAWDWGSVLVARRLWEELGLEEIVKSYGGRSRADGQKLSERAFVLVSNRLCAPTSEHGLGRWLENTFVCDRKGRRWVVQWRDEKERAGSRSPRVRVKIRQLKQWYRTLDQMIAHKEGIERDLFFRLRDLFSLKADLVFYDLTSTYFEGHSPVELGAYGYSRDGKPRNRQVLVGVVMVNGWPIAHHVFRGNLHDNETLQKVVEDLEKRFGLRRVVFVGDRGMVTRKGLEFLKQQRSDCGGHGYLVGLVRRRRPEALRYIERAKGHWIECPCGITASEKGVVPKTFVQEVECDEAGVRVFVVHSEERWAYEQTMRQRAMERTRQALEKLRKLVEQGKLKKPEKIGAAAARILARHHGGRYYSWQLHKGAFCFFENDSLEQEKSCEGKYLIQTEEKDIGAVQAVQVYKELSEVERGFRDMKDVIQMRPIFHQTDRRVKGHIFVASLAFLLYRALEKKLKGAGVDLSASEALQVLQSVRVVDIEVGQDNPKRSVTGGTGRASMVLRALGITELNPPTPPKGDETVM